MNSQTPAAEAPADTAVPSADSAALDATPPTIAVHLFAGAAAEYGRDTETVRAATVQAVVDALTSAGSPQAAQVIGRSSILVNAVACTDTSQVLVEGDRVDVLPPFAGG